MITLDMLKSDEYRELADMPFEKRHCMQNRKKWGVWRWLGIMDNKDAILRLILQPKKRVLDIGGAGGPLGFGSEIIDIVKMDTWGRPVPRSDLSDMPYDADVIFSSHMLEHTENPWMEVTEWRLVLVDGGYLILHVPGMAGYEYWHPSKKPSHKWLFIWDASLPAAFVEDQRIIPLRDTIGEQQTILSGLSIVKIRRVRDNSILVIARKQ